MSNLLKEIIKKIELQSILVLLITLIIGYFLLKEDNSVSTPAGLLGSVSIAFGILYTFGSFFSNQIRESYKDVISEYKSHISTLKTSTKAVSDNYEKLMSQRQQIGEYSTEAISNESETRTD